MARKRLPALLPIAAVVLAGCPVASIYRPDVQLDLAVQPVQVRAGGTARLEFTVRNPGRDTVVLEFEGDCRVTFLVMDPDQRPVGDDGERCADARPGWVVLGGGAEWKTADEWRAFRADGTPLPAGPYLVRGILGEHHSVVRGKRDFKMGHAADTVAVQVLPAG